MGKSFLIFLFIAIVLGGGFAGYLFYSKLKTTPNKAINAIPSNAALIIESQDFQNAWTKLNETTLFWRNLDSVDFIKTLNNNTNFLDSLFSSESKVAMLVKKSPAYISAHPVGANDYSFLFLISLKNIRQISEFQKVVAKTSSRSKINTRVYDNVSITEIILSKVERFSYAFSKGIFIGSFSSMLVEDAIRQLNSGSSLMLMEKNPGFSKVHSTAGEKSSVNLYVNFDHFPDYLSKFVRQKKHLNIMPLSFLANWSALDITLRPKALILNGLTLASDSSGKFLNILFEHQPQEISMTDILPDNTATFIYLGVENFSTYYKTYLDYLDQNNLLYDYHKNLNSVNKLNGVNLEKELISLIGEEIALVTTGNISSPDPNTNSLTDYFVLRLRDPDDGFRQIMGLARKVRGHLGTTSADSLEKYRNHIIGFLDIGSVFNTLLGSCYNAISKNYFTLIDDYVVFANSASDLKSFIGSNLAERTLQRDIHYQTFAENISSKTNCFVYCNIPISLKTGWLQSSFNEELAKTLKSNQKALQEFEALGIQFKVSSMPVRNKDKMLYTNIFLSYNPDYKEKTQLFKHTRLIAPINRKPWIVQNHYTKNHEIFIQDESNNVYLVDKSGNILWQRTINGQIIGEVHQIDIYKNNKLQLLFNTKSHLYLLDRKGRDVESYPVKLAAEATNGMVVFDYDKNKNYRILLACQDMKLYNFDKFGKKVQGWEFKSTNDLVYAPISHMSFAEKDYLVFVDAKGKIYAVDRRGNFRFELKSQFPYLYNDRYIVNKGNSLKNTELIATDSSGTIYMISLNDKIDSLNFDKYSRPPFFDYADFDGDGVKDYLLMGQEELLVYNKEKTLIFNRSFDNNIIFPTISCSIDGNIVKTGVVSDRTEEIFIFNQDGTLADGFPLYGNTPYSIIQENGQTNLIVGAPNKTLYIYTIE